MGQRKKSSKIKVSKHFKKNARLLKLLAKGSKETRKDILKMCDPSLTHAICECTNNIVSGRFPISRGHIEKLRPHIRHLRNITDKKVPLTKRTKIIQQHGGFLPLILGPLASVISGLVSSFAQ